MFDSLCEARWIVATTQSVIRCHPKFGNLVITVEEPLKSLLAIKGSH
jgi:hypothetical protein